MSYQDFLKSYLSKLDDVIYNNLNNSTEEELKKFYRSATGRFILHIVGESNAIIKYSAQELIKQYNISSVTDRSIAINLANELGYHIKRIVPSRCMFKIVLNDYTNPIWKNIKSIKFNNGYKLSNAGLPLSIITDTTFDISATVPIGIGELYQISNYEYNFTTTTSESFNRVKIIGSHDGINISSILYPTLYSEYSSEYLNIIKGSVSEDYDMSKVVFIETDENDNYVLQFGNGMFGNLSRGSYIFNYYTSLGSTANLYLTKNTTINLTNTENITLIDINGKEIYNPSFINNELKIILTTDLNGGEDSDTIEEIKLKAVKTYSIRNTLIRENDFKYYISEEYNIDQNRISIWGDNTENIYRNFQSKELNNIVYLTIKDLEYDFNISTDIYYDICNNKIVDKFDNRSNVFTVVPTCENYSDNKITNCISFKTLYLLGYIKPIVYYYNTLKSENNNSYISNIISNISSISDIKNKYVYIINELMYLPLKIYYTGSSISTFNDIEMLIRKEFNNSNNLLSAINKGLEQNNLSLSHYSIDSIYDNYSEDKTLESHLKYVNIDSNIIKFISDILRINNIKNSYTGNININNISNALKLLLLDTRNTLNVLLPLLNNTNVDVIKYLLSLFAIKINFIKKTSINKNILITHPLFFNEISSIEFINNN